MVRKALSLNGTQALVIKQAQKWSLSRASALKVL